MNSKIASAHPLLQLLLLIGFSLAGVLVFSILGILAATFIMGGEAFSVLSQADFNNPNYIAIMKLLQAMSHLGMFIVPALLMSKLISGSYVKYFQPAKIPPMPAWGLVFLLIYLLQPFISFIAEWNASMTLPEGLSQLEAWMKTMEDSAAAATMAFMSDNTLEGLIVNLLVMAIIPAIGEELVFRGIVQQALQRWLKNAFWAIFVTSCVFSLFHMQFYGFVPRLILGLALGFVFYKSGNIWLASFVHFLNNGTAVLAIWLAENNLIAATPENIEESHFPLYVVIVSTILSLLTLYLFNRFMNKNAERIHYEKVI